MKRNVKRSIIVSLITMLFFIMLLPSTSLANSEHRLDVQIESGLDGKAQHQKGFPVKVTITNNKEDFSGDMIITVPSDYDQAGNLVFPVDIASGTTKEIRFSIPAYEQGFLQTGPNMANLQLVHIYEGSWKDGLEVPIDSSVKIEPSFLPSNRLVIGVLSEQPDTLNYIKLTSFFGNNPEVLPIDGEDLPNETLGLQVLDILVINDFSIVNLPDEQQSALKQWILQGGQLLVGSTPGLMQEMGELTEILPIEINDAKQVQQLTKLEELAGSDFPTEAIDIATGNLHQDANVIYYEEEIPLVSQLKYGLGSVTLFSYDLGSSVLTEWNGYEKAWQSISSSTISTNGLDEGSNQYQNQQSNDLSYIATIFQSLAKIPLSVLVISFFVYVFVVAPILYLVLKRIDKREWSWVIIPSIAIICSIALYFIGAKDRIGQIQSNTNVVMMLDGKGGGSGYGAAGMLSKDSGDYIVSLDSSYQPFPSRSNRYQAIERTTDLLNYPVVEEKNGQTNITFQDVEYWSPRSIGIRVPNDEYGLFATDLKYSNGKLTGTISNQTDYDFHELFLLSGNTHISVGALNAGSTTNIDTNFTQDNLFLSPTDQITWTMYGNQGFMPNQDDDSKRQMLQMALWTLLKQKDAGPTLVGFTNDGLVDIEVDGEETKTNSLNLFVQRAPIGLAEDLTGPITVKLSIPSIHVINGQIHFNGLIQGDPFIDVAPGEYEIVYTIPKTIREAKLLLDEISFSLQGGPVQKVGSTGYEVYNQESASYEPLDIGSNTPITGDSLNRYISENGQIKLITSTSVNGGPLIIPTVEIKGVPEQ